MAPKNSTPEDPTLLEHVFEIRTRLIRALVVFLASTAVCYLRARDLFDFLAAPAQGHLVYLHPVDGMMAYLKLAVLAGLLISSPFSLYQVFAFVAPAMGAPKRRHLGLGLAAGGALFALGAAFALKILPVAMAFLLSYSRPGLQAMLNVDEYFGFVFLLTFGTGFAFETPLLMYLLAASGLVGSAMLIKHWRLAVMACLVVGAVICPTPDLVTWGLVCLTLFTLYLLSIGVVHGVEGKRRRAAELR